MPKKTDPVGAESVIVIGIKASYNISIINTLKPNEFNEIFNNSVHEKGEGFS